MARAFGAVDIIVAGEASEYRLPQQADQRMAAVLAGARVGGQLSSHRAETDGIVEFAIGEQSDIGSDPGAMELKLHAAVEIDPEGTIA